MACSCPGSIEIRLRATRRLDQLRQAQKETVGLATGREGKRKSLGLPENPSDKPTLAEQGIDKNLAHQARTDLDDGAVTQRIAAENAGTRSPAPPAASTAC